MRDGDFFGAGDIAGAFAGAGEFCREETGDSCESDADGRSAGGGGACGVYAGDATGAFGIFESVVFYQGHDTGAGADHYADHLRDDLYQSGIQGRGDPGVCKDDGSGCHTDTVAGGQGIEK